LKTLKQSLRSYWLLYINRGITYALNIYLPGGIELELDLGQGLIAANLGQRLLDRRRLPLDGDLFPGLDRRLLDWRRLPLEGGLFPGLLDWRRLPLDNDLFPGLDPGLLDHRLLDHRLLLDVELDPGLLGLRSRIGLPFGSPWWEAGLGRRKRKRVLHTLSRVGCKSLLGGEAVGVHGEFERERTGVQGRRKNVGREEWECRGLRRIMSKNETNNVERREG
jgi:hypothetical protein